MFLCPDTLGEKNGHFGQTKWNFQNIGEVGKFKE
jgi:hypothetical protein